MMHKEASWQYPQYYEQLSQLAQHMLLAIRNGAWHELDFLQESYVDTLQKMKQLPLFTAPSAKRNQRSYQLNILRNILACDKEMRRAYWRCQQTEFNHLSDKTAALQNKMDISTLN